MLLKTDWSFRIFIPEIFWFGFICRMIQVFKVSLNWRLEFDAIEVFSYHFLFWDIISVFWIQRLFLSSRFIFVRMIDADFFYMLPEVVRSPLFDSWRRLPAELFKHQSPRPIDTLCGWFCTLVNIALTCMTVFTVRLLRFLVKFDK